MIPKVLKPKILAARNYWVRRSHFSRDSLRDYFMLGFGATVMFSIYFFVTWVLHKLNADPNLVFLPPSLPLGLIFMVLFLMLMLSNIVMAVGTLYFGSDLELIIASPLRPYQFFGGKLFYILLTASWTSIIFIAPLVIGFGVSFHAGWAFYVLSVVVFIPYFVIPAAFSIIAATLFVRFIPPRYLKYLLYLVALILIAGLILGSDLFKIGVASARDHGQLLRVLSLISAANANWLPSTWVSNVLQNLLQYQGHAYGLYVLMLYSVAVAMCAGAYLVLQGFHFDAYSLARNQGSRRRITSRPQGAVHWTQSLSLAPQFRGMAVKDSKIFIREVTSTLQVAMLGAMCLIYLFNVKLFSGVEGLPIGAQNWWRSFFFISNWCIGAFVTTGVCTRFVFPAVSLEGKNLWVLQSAPISLTSVLRAKFRLWYVPVAAISVGVLTAGAVAMGARTWLLGLNVASGFIVAYGITGLAIGLGARFSNFEWEHPSELAASFGSLLFMLTSVMLIFISLFIAWISLSYNLLYLVGVHSHGWGRQASVVAGLACMTAIHVISARLALQGGEATLKEREAQ
jgi:ABC-2 type transport system permease protein